MNDLDLVILTPDRNTTFLLLGILPRIPKIENININVEIEFNGTTYPKNKIINSNTFKIKITEHYLRDPGILTDPCSILRPLMSSNPDVLVILDCEGSGKEQPSEIEKIIQDNLLRNGWNKEKIFVVAISPELENWVWVNPNKLKQLLEEWTNASLTWLSNENIYEWLEQNPKHKPFKLKTDLKPKQPKEAFEKILQLSNLPRSSDYYRKLAEKASYQECEDPAFLKFREKITALLRKKLPKIHNEKN